MYKGYLFVLMIIILAGISSCGNVQVKSAQPNLEEYSQPPEPSCSDPLCGGESVSFLQAQTVTAYHIPLPAELTIQQVWIHPWGKDSAEEPIRRSVAIQFENDILLRIHPLDRQPDWDRLVAQDKDFKKIIVNGVPGIGADPGVEIYDGEEYFRRGSTVWWENGLKYGLYTDTVPLEELLKVAETLY